MVQEDGQKTSRRAVPQDILDPYGQPCKTARSHIQI